MGVPRNFSTSGGPRSAVPASGEVPARGATSVGPKGGGAAVRPYGSSFRVRGESQSIAQLSDGGEPPQLPAQCSRALGASNHATGAITGWYCSMATGVVVCSSHPRGTSHGRGTLGGIPCDVPPGRLLRAFSALGRLPAPLSHMRRSRVAARATERRARVGSVCWVPPPRLSALLATAEPHSARN